MVLTDLSDDELRAEAEQRGIEGAETMSRDELVHAIEVARGGLRSLLKSGIEKVVDRLLPTRRTDPAPPGRGPQEAETNEPILTRTMAGLLASQGYDQRALAIYERLIESSADAELHAEATALRRRVALGTGEQRFSMVALPMDGASLLVAWQLAPEAIARAQAVLGSPGELTARVVIVAPDKQTFLRHETLEREAEPDGEWLLRELPAGAKITASIGVRTDARFVSAAHTPVTGV
ncbi:MAG: hypothetical protein AAGF12_23415 [Myxococcota bacterium]